VGFIPSASRDDDKPAVDPPPAVRETVPAADAFGRPLYVGDVVHVVAGLWINRRGTVLDVSPVSGRPVTANGGGKMSGQVTAAAVRVDGEGVRVIEPRSLQLWNGERP
jgi:hypothetical protein